MKCDAMQTRWAGSSPQHEKGAGRHSVCLKYVSPAPNQSPTILSYLLRSALVGIMALDRIIPKEWFVLCEVHIWEPAKTWVQHIICCMNIKCVMEETLHPNSKCLNSSYRNRSRWGNAFMERNPCSVCEHVSLQSSTLLWWCSNDGLPSCVKLSFL